MHRILIIPALLIAPASHAQSDTIRSEAIEMKAAKSIAFTDGPTRMQVDVFGEHDRLPAPTSCAGTDGEARKDCLSTEVLKVIRAEIEKAGLTDDSGYPATVLFTLNEYGEVRSVQVERTGGTNITKPVIVALNSLRQIEAATLEGTAVGASVRITIPAERLFPEQ